MVVGEKMTVMQVRPAYSIIYQFKPQLKIDEICLKDRRTFISFLKESASWKDWEYFLKCSKGTFAFFVVDGRKIVLVKRSIKGKNYLCWDYFE